MKHLIAIVLTLMSSAASAVDYGLSISAASHHFGDQLPCNVDETGITTYNEANYGLGVKATYSREWAAEVGAFRNSIDNTSIYALAKWTPLTADWVNVPGQRVRLGLAFGAATGYCWKVMPIAAGLLSIPITKKIGIDVMAAPETKKSAGVITAQITYSF